MVEHKRLVSRVKRQRKPLSSSYRDEKVVEPIPNRANFQSRVLGTLLMLFCLKGPGFLCTPSFLRKTGNFKSRICVLIAVLLPLVFLSVTAHAAEGDIRLGDVERSAENGTIQGYLEVEHNGVWKGVCDDYFTDDDAGVACRQLSGTTHPGLGKALVHLDGPSDDFWLDDMLCKGDETKLSLCPRSHNPGVPGQNIEPGDSGYWGNDNCRNYEYAGAVCYETVTTPKAPKNLTATPRAEEHAILLEWTAPYFILEEVEQKPASASHMYSIVTGYKIEVSEDGGNNWDDLVSNTMSTRTIHSHIRLDIGDTRHYRVSAINSAGTGDPSNIASATVGGTGSVDEPGTVTLSSSQPQVGTAVTATLSDPDGSVSSVTWEWHRSTDQNNWGSPITDATSASYTPVAGDVGYYLRATASYSDGQGSGKSAEVVSQNQVQAAPVLNRAPEFPYSAIARSVDENTGAGQNIGAPVEATDQNSDTLEYSLGGTDAASFDIEDGTGQLKTKAALDYEGKSPYSVVVTAKDPSNASDAIAVTISVVNVDEPGTVTLSASEPRVTMEVTATLSDPDGSVSSVTWEWHRSTDQNNWGSPITGATSASYTPGVDDELRYLRATASYTDPEGSGKSAQGVSDNVVPDENWPPEFSDETATRSVAENTPAGENIGDPFTATEPENDTLEYSLGGMDAASFTIETINGSGQIKTKDPLNYEHKNSYSVDVVAADTLGASDSIRVTINVTDMDEDGEVTLSPVQPQVDTASTATLSDPDVPVSGITWKWYKSSTRNNSWAVISGATSASYTPVTGDVNNYLRATATYTDRHGSSKTAHGISDLVVRVEPPSNNPPEFPSNTQNTFSVAENTPAGEDIGEVTATDSDSNDAGKLTYSLGGTDGNSFRLDDQTAGQILTYAALNYEHRNSYSVVVTAEDPSKASDTIMVTINVTDVDEPGILTLSPSQPRVGSAVRATLREPDDGLSNLSWEWHRSLDKSSGSWSPISGETSDRYTPVADDIGSYLQATASYDDKHSPPGKEVQAVSANPVRVASTTTNNGGTRSTSATTVPRAPRDLTATGGDGEVTLGWRVPDDGGSAIKYYEYKVDNGAWTSTGGKSTTYTVTGLTNGQPYEFRVRAVNSEGYGAESEPISATPATVPGAPRNLGGAQGNAEVTLSWDAPDDGGSFIERYEYKVDSSTWISTGGKATTYTVMGLTSGQTYEFRVRAVNSIGSGAASQPASIAPATGPGAPRNLTLTSGDQYMMLIWERPEDNGGLRITGYEYSQKEENGSFGEWTSIDNSAPGEANETSYAVTGLKNGTVYSFRVRAVNEVGPGDPSAEATAEVNTPSFRRARRASLNILPTFGRTMARNSVDALTWRLDSVLSGSFERTGMFRLMDQHAGLHEVLGTDIWDDPDQWEELSLEELLYGSSFIIEAGVMPRKPKEYPKEYSTEYPKEDSADENMWINEDEKPVAIERKGDIGFWGKADYNNLSVSGDELFAWDGKMVSGYMGVDRWVNEKVLTGLSVSLTKGNFDYTDATPGEEGRGDYYVKMLSVSPYVSWFLSDDVYLWSALGYGRGGIDIDDEEAHSVASSDLSYKSVAVGGSGRLFDVGDTTFSLKSEAFKVWMDVEGDDYLIDELSVGVHQLRLSMEGSYEYRFASGTWFNPLVEVALRHDGGDGETGTGVELGGGFLYENPNLGLSVSGRGRWLAAHSSQEFSQWGVGGAVIFDTGADKRGALFSVAPEWGDTSSGVEGLWERGVEGLSSKDGGDAGMHLDAEFGYGLSALGGDGLLTPYSGLRLGGDGRRQYRLGSRLDLGRSASLSLETDRRQSDTTKPEHGIMLRGKLNF